MAYLRIELTLPALLLLVQGCAGAAPNPVSIVQVQDRHMTCDAIFAEVQSNNEKVQQLGKDKGLKVAQNVAAGVAGFVIPILWFGMDWQDSAGKEVQALQARQQYLATLAEQRRCGAPVATSALPAQPAPHPKR
jgi:hypothetical protein